MYLTQLGCMTTAVNSDGIKETKFSLDVLIPNLIAAGLGFCLTYFIVGDMILGGKKNA